MTDEEIKDEVMKITGLADLGEREKLAVQLVIHRERPPQNPFQGHACFLSDDCSIAFLVSRLPSFQLAYDVYVTEE